jgi:hypothetical protein
VTVVTVPPGAEVLDAAGRRLCAATPCAVPVPAGQTLPVRLVRGAASLPATLDGNSPSARIDLSALDAPPTAPTPTTPGDRAGRRPERRRPTGNPAPQGDPPAAGEGDLPMVLPHKR